MPALTLHTGSNTHFTVVYFSSLGNHTKEETLDAAIKWCDNNVSDGPQIRITVGPLWQGGTSIYVTGRLAEIKAGLMAHFIKNGWAVDTAEHGSTAHINLKNQDKAVLASHVNLKSKRGWAWM